MSSRRKRPEKEHLIDVHFHLSSSLEKMAWLRVGQRVFVKEETGHALRLHEYSRLEWNIIYNPMTTGKVGRVMCISEDRQSATVRFYVWLRNDECSDSSDNQLMAIDVEWHVRALRPLHRIHFEIGDHAVLEQPIDNSDTDVHLVTVRSVRNSDGEEQLFSLETMNKQHTIYWRQRERRFDALLPIYAEFPENGFDNQLLVHREPVDEQSFVYLLPSRLLHGMCEAADGTQMVTTTSNGTRRGDGAAQFAQTVQNYFGQINISSANGYTPIMFAVADGNWTAAITLLALGDERDALDVNGNTLLHIAAERGHTMIVENLLTLAGCEMNRPNFEGDMPMHLAVKGQHAACVDRLESSNHFHSNFQNFFTWVLGDSDSQRTDRIFNQIRISELSWRHSYAYCLRLPESPAKMAIIGRLLANFRLNLYVYNEDQLTPIHILIFKDCHRTMELILRLRPQQLNADTGNGFPPLLLAAFYGCRKCTESLIQFKADVSRCSKLGRTALHLALGLWHGSVDKDTDRLACVQALVYAGCPLNVQDCSGDTVLHLLVKHLNKLVFTTTSPEGVGLPNSMFHAINSCNNLRRMNLHDIASLVRPHWQFACLCFIAANGADPSLVDRYGVSVLDRCLDKRVGLLLSNIANTLSRRRFPMNANFSAFDPPRVTMFTFNNEDSQADVCFVPCGHCVVCKQCARNTLLRRCPICYKLIEKAISDGIEIEIGAELLQKAAILREEERRKAHEEIGRLTAAAAKQAKLDAEREKQHELEELRTRLDKLEMETSCPICMDARPNVVFNCGHTGCSNCTSPLKSCHICRQPITKKQNIYA